MSDSTLSASELRARYAAGGSVPDSELSASQLRARHAVKANARDFSTRDNAAAKGEGVSGALILGVAVAVVAVVVALLLRASAAAPPPP